MATKYVRRLDKNHDTTWGQGRKNYANTGEATLQRVRTDLLVILGEAFLNAEDGVPWFQPEDSDVQPILGGRRDLAYTEGVLKARVLNSDGVATLTSYSQSFDARGRRLTVSIGGTTVDGDEFQLTVVSP
ncbi:MAG TPA: hypothetical protein VJV74_02515 [Terriglobia bacterium]|nr:hypothetical protein [Terriglobia bacterium]